MEAGDQEFKVVFGYWSSKLKSILGLMQKPLKKNLINGSDIWLERKEAHNIKASSAR